MANNGAIEDLPVRSLSHIVGNDGSGQAARQPTNTLVPTSRQVVGDTGLTGGGQLSGDVTIKLSSSSLSSLGKADSAMQPSVYDPEAKGADAFDSANHRFEAEVSDFPRPTIRKLRDHVALLDNMASGSLDLAISHREATTADAAEITSLAQEVLSDCATNLWAARIPGGLYYLNANLAVDQPIALIGDGSANSRLQFTADATDGGGITVTAGESSQPTLLSDFSLTTEAAGVGTAFTIDYTGTAGDTSIRNRSRALIRGLNILGAGKSGDSGWLNGIETINVMYAYIGEYKFIGYLVSSAGPYNEGKALYFHGESGTGYGPVSHYVSDVSVSASGYGLVSQNLEGVYFNTFDLVNVKKGILIDNLVGEPGLNIHTGHINSFDTAIDLNNSMQFNVRDVIIYQSATPSTDVVKFIVRGTDTADGFIGKINNHWTVNSLNSTALQLQVGTNISVETNIFNIPSSSATSRCIEIQSGCSNIDIAKQNVVAATSRMLDNGVGTTFEERWGYSGSLNNITMSSRRAKQLHMLVTGAAGLPGGGVAANATVETYSSSATTGFQTFRNAAGNGVWRRDYVSSAWSSWRRQDGAGNVDADYTNISSATSETLTIASNSGVTKRQLTANVKYTITISGTNASVGDMMRLRLAFSNSVGSSGEIDILDNNSSTQLTLTGTSETKQYAIEVIYTGSVWRIFSCVQSLV